MAKVKVRYTVEYYQEMDWPDDELDNLDECTALLNTDVLESQEQGKEISAWSWEK